MQILPRVRINVYFGKGEEVDGKLKYSFFIFSYPSKLNQENGENDYDMKDQNAYAIHGYMLGDYTCARGIGFNGTFKLNVEDLGKDKLPSIKLESSADLYDPKIAGIPVPICED